MPKCDKHDECMKDIRDTARTSADRVAKLEGIVSGFTKAAQDYIDASRKDLYSKGGLIDRTGNHASQLTLQWGVFTVLFIAMVYIALN